jgi:hypothetical protein
VIFALSLAHCIQVAVQAAPTNDEMRMTMRIRFRRNEQLTEVLFAPEDRGEHWRQYTKSLPYCGDWCQKLEAVSS